MEWLAAWPGDEWNNSDIQRNWGHSRAFIQVPEHEPFSCSSLFPRLRRCLQRNLSEEVGAIFCKGESPATALAEQQHGKKVSGKGGGDKKDKGSKKDKESSKEKRPGRRITDKQPPTKKAKGASASSGGVSPEVRAAVGPAAGTTDVYNEEEVPPPPMEVADAAKAGTAASGSGADAGAPLRTKKGKNSRSTPAPFVSEEPAAEDAEGADEEEEGESTDANSETT